MKAFLLCALLASLCGQVLAVPYVEPKWMTTKAGDRFEIERMGGKLGVKGDIRYYATVPKFRDEVLAKQVQGWVADCARVWGAPADDMPTYCEVSVSAVSENKRFLTLVSTHQVQYEGLDRLYGAEAVRHYARRAGGFVLVADKSIISHAPQCQKNIGELLIQSSRALAGTEETPLRNEDASPEDVFRSVHIQAIGESSLTFAEGLTGNHPRAEISLSFAQLGKCLLLK
jgi:hypothetical protein